MGFRAKFTCTKKDPNPGDASIVEVEFEPRYGDGTDNASWSKWTPGGRLSMQITNPDVTAQIEIGKVYFLDITPA